MQINTAVFTKTTIVMVNRTALMPVMRVDYVVSVPVSLFLIRLVYQCVESFQTNKWICRSVETPIDESTLATQYHNCLKVKARLQLVVALQMC